MNGDILNEKNIDEAWFEIGDLFIFAVVKDINDEGYFWTDEDNKCRLVFQIQGSPDWAVFDGAKDIDPIIETLQKLKQRMIRHELSVAKESVKE